MIHESITLNELTEPCDGIKYLIPATEEEIEIEKLVPSGEYNAAMFAYTPIRYGQAAFLMEECKREGIRVRYNYGKLEIFSILKLIQFRKIILKSFIYETHDTPDVSKLCPHVTFSIDGILLCVYIKHNDTIYTTESKIKKVVSYIFQKRIPRPSNYHICSTKEELEETLAEKENVLVMI